MQTPASPEEGVVTGSEKLREVKTETTAYSLKINPQTGFRNSVFHAFSENIRLSGVRIQWLKNGEQTASVEGTRFIPQDISKGDTVQARVFIDNREILSNPVKIKNSPPQVTSVNIDPQPYKPDDPLAVGVEWNDIDGDDVTITYEWTKNGEPAGRGKKIEVAFKRGDKLVIKIISFDGEDYGEPVFLSRQIQNMPPKIKEDLTFNFDGKVYTYQVKAEDPDNDPLTFSLTSAIEDMSINPKTGMVTWNVPADFTGKVPFTVSVTDGMRGEATRELTFTINPPQ